MMNMKSILLMFLVVSLIGPSFSFAQSSSVTSKTNYVKIKDKKATLNFEDELVEGSTQKPELFYLFQKKNFNYKRLIKLRENFLPELRNNAENMQRVRSSN
jgi:hypothetical protein